jgi:transcriptional regulator with XRE-family HTH domain
MKDKYPSPFSRNIRKARSLKGITQEQAAELLGIKRSRLGSYEEGRAEPDYKTLVDIVKIYGITDMRSFLLEDYDFSNSTYLPVDLSEYKNRLSSLREEAENIMQTLSQINLVD